ncbi:hypothetical protein C8J57DRAFT_383957 [Mycena rebaudengoi]|nr:hypothetical protein C8J57DRAFT_383957 [Mycena rebaudengoi]
MAYAPRRPRGRGRRGPLHAHDSRLDVLAPLRLRLRLYSVLPEPTSKTGPKRRGAGISTGTTSFFSLSSPGAASFSRSRCRSHSRSCSLYLSRSRSRATSESFACSSFLRACHSWNDTLATGGGAGVTTGGGSRASAAGAGGSDESDAAVIHTCEGGCTVIGDTAFSFSPDGMSGSTHTDTASSSARTRGGMSSWTLSSGSSSDFGTGLRLAGEGLYGRRRPKAARRRYARGHPERLDMCIPV